MLNALMIAILPAAPDCGQFQSTFARMECREAVRDADRWPDLAAAAWARAIEYEMRIPKHRGDK